MKKNLEKTKEIIQALLDKTRKTKGFTYYEIMKAIQTTTDAVDKRTLKNWWDYLWGKNLFTQPVLHVYDLDLGKTVELFEVKVPLDIDPNQKRLGAFT